MNHRSVRGFFAACTALIISLVLALTAALPSAIAQIAPDLPGIEQTAPNILVILTDDQDAMPDMLDAMPNLRALLVDQGMTFSDFLVPLPLCCPARATLLLGQYSHNSQILQNTPPIGGFPLFYDLGLEENTIATALDAAGYETGLIGKYLNLYPNADNPTHIPPGWDEWFVPITSSAYGSFDYDVNDNGVIVSYGTEPEDHISDVITAQAVSFITRTATTAPASPFFLQLSYYAPHGPATAAPRHLHMFPGAQAPRTPSFNESDMSDKPSFMQELPLLPSSTIATMDAFRRRQLQSLQSVDEGIATLVQTLQDVGRLDNTYIFFLSDNGLHMGQHRFVIGKGAPFEEDIVVPLIVRGPGVPAGVVRSELAALIDIVPTLAEIGGATLTMTVDGRSLYPLLHSTAPPTGWRQMVLLEHWQPGSAEAFAQHAQIEPPDPGDDYLRELLVDTGVDPESLNTPDWLGFRTSDYKYIDRVGPAVELYDIANDRYELYNQYTDATTTFQAEMAATLAALFACAGQTCRDLEELPPPAYSLRYHRADINRDSRVDLTDVVMTVDCWAQPVVGACGDRFDLDYDADIDVTDIMRVAAAWDGLAAAHPLD